MVECSTIFAYLSYSMLIGQIMPKLALQPADQMVQSIATAAEWISPITAS